MKKILWVLVLTSLLLIGCEQDALKYFQDAAVKTDEIVRAKSMLVIHNEIEMSSLLTDAQSDLAALLRDVTYTSEKQFDKTSNESIVRQYLGTTLMGFDTVFYNNKGFEYIKVPFVGKYIKVEDLFDFDALNVDTLEGNTFDTSVYQEAPITAETLDAIEKAWYDLIEEDDVVNLGKEVVDTPEGEVKVKKLVVTFSNEQVKTFLNKALDLIDEDEKFKEEFKNYLMYSLNDQDEMTLTEMDIEIDSTLVIESVRTLIDDLIVEEFKMVSYVDVDQYIIESQYDIHLSFVGNIGDYIKSIQLTVSYQLYELHEAISFDFPEMNDQNTITLSGILDQLNDKIPDFE